MVTNRVDTGRGLAAGPGPETPGLLTRLLARICGGLYGLTPHSQRRELRSDLYIMF